MDVVFITMVFPWPSEAFAGVEVRALRRAGAKVRVRALRARHAKAEELLRDWRLDGLDLESWSARSVLGGFVFSLRHPLMAGQTFGWLVRHGWRRPVLLARCVLLLPRIFAIFGECLARPPGALVLFWGHYPSVLAYMARRWLPQVHVAMSLVAYDLVYGFPPSVEAARGVNSLWTITRANLPAIGSLGLDPRGVRISPHGIDPSQVPPPGTDKDLAKLVTIARLEENKGVDDAIRAFAAIALPFSTATLTIIGEGPDRVRLEGLVAELGLRGRVVFTGGIGHSLVYDHLRSAGVLLLLSRSPAERLPNAVKEAMACRCLCIVTQTPGIEELLSPLSNRMVVKQGDWQAAAHWLELVLAKPAAFEADRDSSRQFILEALNANNLARERLRVWEGLV